MVLRSRVTKEVCRFHRGLQNLTAFVRDELAMSQKAMATAAVTGYLGTGSVQVRVCGTEQ